MQMRNSVLAYLVDTDGHYGALVSAGRTAFRRKERRVAVGNTLVVRLHVGNNWTLTLAGRHDVLAVGARRAVDRLEALVRCRVIVADDGMRWRRAERQ